MHLKDDFVFRPLPSVRAPARFALAGEPNPLGPLTDLVGCWEGSGLNVIWRPFDGLPDHDNFLELNRTSDNLTFEVIPGPIPNRGLLQADMNMFGVTYLQQVSDANLNAGLHIEPGIWAVVPATTNPQVPRSVVRMGSIPHGTSILAQGFASTAAGPPAIPNNSIVPFLIGDAAKLFPFPSQDLSTPSDFRSPPPQLVGLTQQMVDNPNSLLQAALAGQTILSTTTLSVKTASTLAFPGGGTANTAFLAGGASGPNAVAAEMEATFWIQTVESANPGEPPFLQLQYSQVVMLNFNTLSWPHISVGTLRKSAAKPVPPQKVDPGSAGKGCPVHSAAG